MTNNISIAAVIMVKNEEKFIHTTINSLKGQVDGLIMYDTGSTDKTISISKKLAKQNDLNFHLLKGEFEDFASSRNRLLRFADTFDYDYLLLLDCNDELKVSQTTLKEILAVLDPGIEVFLVQQKWFICASETLQYFSTRLIKPQKGLEYEGVVHEFMKTNDKIVSKLDSDKVHIYQNRANGDNKSNKRWENDLVLLEKEFLKNPANSRTQYYLAQTYDCLNKKLEAKKMYQIRADNVEGFQEERFLAMMRIGKLCRELGEEKSEQIKWFYKAYFCDKRVEPLVELSKIFRDEKDFKMSFHIAKIACSLEYPNRIFLVNKKNYEHDRWQEISISAYYIGEFEEGKAACLKCIDSGYEKTLNENNLKFYN
jgi:glycosyltransferase involved in cell wall biosynthesis